MKTFSLDSFMNVADDSVRVMFETSPKPAGAFKQHVLTKRTIGTFLAGKHNLIRWNESEFKLASWQAWDVVNYVVRNKTDENKTGQVYVALRPDGHEKNTEYFVDGQLVSVSEFAKYLTPSNAAKLGQSDVTFYSVKLENVEAFEPAPEYNES